MPPLTRLDGPTNPGSYIVFLQPSFSRSDVLIKIGLNDSHPAVTHKWDPEHLNGFAGKFNQAQLNAIQELPEVAFVTEDGIASAFDTVTQTDASWGSARVSQDEGLAIRTTEDTSDFEYTYDESAGNDVDIYILDTGIYTEHNDFGGRATWGMTFVGDKDADGNGHGTHCAGIAAGTKYGVAKRANLIAVKVLDDNAHGPYSDIISGLIYVLIRFLQSGVVPVVNMSLGGPPSWALDFVVILLISRGVHVVVAAGNSSSGDPEDAGKYSPARVKEAITVGASAIDDSMWYFTRTGSCLDIFAPGDDITSTWIGSKDATLARSGTSMATPNVAGLVAYSLALDGDCTPANMKSDLQKAGVSGILTKIRSDTPNILASNYSLYTASANKSSRFRIKRDPGTGDRVPRKKP